MEDVTYEIDGSVAYSVTRRMCSNFNEVIASMIDNQYIHIGEVADGIHAGFLPNKAVVMAKKLDVIHFNMRWEVKYKREEDGSLLIWHHPSPSSGAFMGVDWVIPEGMDTYFVYDGAYNYHLITIDPDNGNTTPFPLPNVYNTGRLCTGDINAGHGSHTARFEKALKQWSQNNWNTDLYYDLGRRIVPQLIRFDENMKQMPSLVTTKDFIFVQPEVDISIIKRMREIEEEERCNS